MQLVTIGIPCYNSEKWLEVAIRSALEQSHRPTEIIVVDDGSTDGSREIARQFGNEICLIEQPKSGANAARNTILSQANGDWLQYLDADDYLKPVKIAVQLREAADQVDAADILYAPTFSEDWSLGEAYNRTENSIDSDRSLYEQWLLWQLPQTGGCLWRRTSLEKLGGWDEAAPCCQEHELYLRAIIGSMRMVLTPSPGAVYRIWSEATLCRKNPKLVIEVKSKLIEQMIEWLEQTKRTTKATTQAAGRAFFEMARTLARYDLDAAIDYHDQYHKRGLINLKGTPAAPWKYRLAYKLTGFRSAEKLASATRGKAA